MTDKTAEKKSSPKKKAIDGLMETVDNLWEELHQTPYPLTTAERNMFTHSLLGFHSLSDKNVIINTNRDYAMFFCNGSGKSIKDYNISLNDECAFRVNPKENRAKYDAANLLTALEMIAQEENPHMTPETRYDRQNAFITAFANYYEVPVETVRNDLQEQYAKKAAQDMEEEAIQRKQEAAAAEQEREQQNQDWLRYDESTERTFNIYISNMGIQLKKEGYKGLSDNEKGILQESFHDLSQTTNETERSGIIAGTLDEIGGLPENESNPNGRLDSINRMLSGYAHDVENLHNPTEKEQKPKKPSIVQRAKNTARAMLGKKKTK